MPATGWVDLVVMTTVDVDIMAAYSSGPTSICRRPPGAALYSSNEPGELSQWLYRDDSTINIIVSTTTTTIIINVYNNG